MNYAWRLTCRRLRKRTSITVINVVGLACGLAFVLLASRYIQTESSMDRFHDGSRSLYRVERSDSSGVRTCFSPNILAAWLQDNCPEIEAVARILNDGFEPVNARNLLFAGVKYEIEKPLIADSAFFDMFSFRVLTGETGSFDRTPRAMVVTESLAARVFGRIDPLGRIVRYKDELYTITAVLADPPSQSSLTFDLLLPVANLPDYVTNDWRNHTLQIFVRTGRPLSPAALEDKINAGIRSAAERAGQPRPNGARFLLNPLRRIYYSEVARDNICLHGNRRLTFLLASVALLVLLIALINFVNIAGVRAADRIREIGVRAVSGASRLDQIRALTPDSLLPALLAAGLALELASILGPALRPLLNVPLAGTGLPHMLIVFAGVSILGLAAGSWPAVRMSPAWAIESLKGRTRPGPRRSLVRDVLPVAQFAVSIALVFALIVIHGQIGFMVRQSSRALDPGPLIYLSLADRTPEANPFIGAVREALTQLAEVEGVASSLHLPGDEVHSDMGLTLRTAAGEEAEVRSDHNLVSAEYPDILGCEIVRGRTFDSRIGSDRGSYLVNETFARTYGLGELDGAVLGGSPVIGIIRDYHYGSLRSRIAPLALKCSDAYQSRILVRLAAAGLVSSPEVRVKIDRTVAAIDETAASGPRLLVEHVAALYARDVRVAKIVSWFSMFSLLISALGLFATSLVSIASRTKEIGIRKVLGGTAAGIALLLTRDSCGRVLAGAIIAWPAAWYAMSRWLRNFAYHISIEWWVFAAAAGLALAAALATVSILAVRAARTNPVDALKYE